jgi:hypothetical protein
MTPKNLHDIMNGINTPQDAMEVEDEADDDIDERSPLKKQSGSSKTASRSSRSTQVTPPKTKADPPMATSNTKTATLLDTFSYPYPRTIIELAITLKSDKAFEEFAQALMAFITNVQMVDLKFVINPVNPTSKEKNIISQRGDLPKYDQARHSYQNIWQRKRFQQEENLEPGPRAKES